MKRTSGFTLVELITVIAILGIGMGLFYSIFYLNWTSFEKQLTLNDLVQEADRIMERISFEVKGAYQIDVSDDKTVSLTYANGAIVSYTINDQGQILRNNQILSEYINSNSSSFAEVSNSLVVELLLEDDVLGQVVQLPVETQIFKRNRL